MIGTMEKLKTVFDSNLQEYRSIPFWSWNNELDENILVRQIEEMKNVGIGGFVIHARAGLKTEYLGEKWFSCVKVCLNKAKELDMRVWIYDDNGWPSGFVGGKLLQKEEYRACFLEYKIENEFDFSAFCVYEKTNFGYKRIFGKKEKLKEYHCIYKRRCSSNTDILNREVVEAFIAETHEKYYERFKDSFGRELAGFFTDEPQYYRWATPYPVSVGEEFEKKYGEDVKDGLIYLFLKDPVGYSFRTRYYTLLNELYVRVYYKSLYDWCSQHHCCLTGHSVEEPHLYTQMWGGAGVMPTYEYEHIPGIDSLGVDGEYFLSSKQVGSVAAQLGKKFVLTEIYGACGHDVTPAELKHSAEKQYFNGVNLMCQHLIPYSISGQGKHDCPPIFYKQNNWWEDFKEFNEYFARLGYVIANTREECDVLVMHPMRSVYLEYIRDEDFKSVSALEDSFERILTYLNANGVAYQLADETLLLKYGKLEEDKIKIGKCRYSSVIVPQMHSISQTTLNLLNRFKGKLCVLGEIGYLDGIKRQLKLNGNTRLEEFIRFAPIGFKVIDGNGALTVRSGELGRFIFIKNQSLHERMTFELDLKGESFSEIDLLTSKIHGGIAKAKTLNGGESLILIQTEESGLLEEQISASEVTGDFKIVEMSPNFFLSDKAKISCDGIYFGEEQPLPKIFENLLYERFEGRVFVKHEFIINDVLPLKLMIENNEFLSAYCNGHPLEFFDSDFDVNFKETEISAFLKKGSNEFVYSVHYRQREEVRYAFFDPFATESLRNCLRYDIYIEPIYLKGDFIVGNDGAISERKKMPAVSAELYKNGYPFFYGHIKLRGIYHYDGTETVKLLLQGRYVAMSISANGKTLRNTFGGELDITPILNRGANEITLTVKSSLRNLFGPHHLKGFRDGNYAGADTFTLYGNWKDGFAPLYDPNYQLAPFGVEKIIIKKYVCTLSKK